jgi:hypothetical protein
MLTDPIANDALCRITCPLNDPFMNREQVIRKSQQQQNC